MMAKDKDIKIPYNVTVNLNVSYKNSLPAIELRRLTTDPNIIKIIIMAAFSGQPVTIFPVLNNQIRAVDSFQRHGILKFNPSNNEYKFLI